jgi:hypothetical protein
LGALLDKIDLYLGLEPAAIPNSLSQSHRGLPKVSNDRPGAKEALVHPRPQAIHTLTYGAVCFVLMVIVLIAADEIEVGGTSGFLALYTLAIGIIVVGAQICVWCATGPLFAVLPRSSERITFGERARMNAAATPLWRLLASDLVLPFLMAGTDRIQRARASLCGRRLEIDHLGVALDDRRRG